MLDPRGDYTLVNGNENSATDLSRGENNHHLLMFRAVQSLLRRIKFFLLFNSRPLAFTFFSLLIILLIFYYTTLDNSLPMDEFPTKMIAQERHQHIIARSSAFKKQIVHFDLKGAAPRPNYLIGLFPLFKKIGFTGILMEYEDMFPYEEELAPLARKSAYNAEMIQQFQKAAESNGLELIPLLQTFGHMEFALKHKQFISLREDQNYMDTICPSKEKSIDLIRKMFAQVRKLHPLTKSIHIGCDEAWHIARDEACQRQLNTTFHGSVERLKLAHISRIARIAKHEFGFETVYAWNDMFEKMSVQLLREYELGDLLIPVVWGYARDVTKPGYFANGVIERFSEVFAEVLFAGAFKGANGVTQQFVDIQRYLDNLISYRRFYEQHEKPLKGRLTGFFITGWQRFSHEKPLCELLPSGIPSLVREAIFLSNWKNGNHAGEEQELRKFLNCSSVVGREEVLHHNNVPFPFELELDLGECQFPGVDLYKKIEELRLLRWRASVEDENAMEEVKQGHEEKYQEVRKEMVPLLRRYFYEDTVDEWLAQHSHLQNFKDDDPSVHRFDPIL